MVCGFCGTEINAGFSTCSRCGAELRKGVGCLGQVLGFLAIILVLLGIISMALGLGEDDKSHVGLVFGLVLWAVAIGMMWLGRKFGSYKWVRLGPGR